VRADKGQVQTADTFTRKWESIPEYGYSVESEKFRLQWYLHRYGWTETEFSRFLRTRRMILDAGTGLGSHVKMYADMVAGTRALVFGVDLSDSIHIANQRVGRMDNVHLLQADINRLPFPDRQFDFIVADQVIHHTPDTREAFRNLVRLLDDGGQIAIYVYNKKAAIRELVDDYIRGLTTRMTWEECVEFCEQVTLLGKALTEMKAVVDVEQDIPLLGVKAGKQDAQRFIYWNIMKCFWNPDLDMRTNVMVNADWYHPVYAWRHTPAEVEEWFRDERLEIVFERVEESGISVRGRK
jgi:ubiquinone/menaquinone biosynthesis C-methylase UbiE